MSKFLLVVTVLAVITLGILNLTYQDGIEPDVICPMANRNITWYYAGK